MQIRNNLSGYIFECKRSGDMFIQLATLKIETLVRSIMSKCIYEIAITEL